MMMKIEVAYSLRNGVKHYLRKTNEIEAMLSKHPQNWGNLQAKFNREITGLFEDILLFEIKNNNKGDHEKTNKLKAIFETKYKKYFLKGEYVNWVYDKPYGYAGDFWIIDALYRNHCATEGIDRLFDNYYLGAPVAQAVRNRKDEFKRLLYAKVVELRKTRKEIYILNIASGPCREIAELLRENSELFSNVYFDCLDQEKNAHDYARKLIGEKPNVNYINKNAIRISTQTTGFKKHYDIIYSMGLFDYLSHKAAVKLISNVQRFITPGGMLIIANAGERFSNISVYFMEWVAGWYLIYRTEEEFKSLFLDGGYQENELSHFFENEGIFQYIVAVKR